MDKTETQRSVLQKMYAFFFFNGYTFWFYGVWEKNTLLAGILLLKPDLFDHLFSLHWPTVNLPMGQPEQHEVEVVDKSIADEDSFQKH